MAGEKKRPRTEAGGKATKAHGSQAGPSKPKPDTPAPRPAPAFISSLVNDEGDFPRGGGTTLSAFELKQVRDEGRREAEAELAAEGGHTAKKPRRQISEREARRKQKNEIKPAKVIDKDSIRVEHLNYKRLTDGTRVLVRIHTILPLHLIVSLANNLLAHIPITEVSSTLTHLLSQDEEAMADTDDEERALQRDIQQTAPELSQIFSPGQYFTAKVINTFPTASQSFMSQYPVSETTRLAARVELSLMPEKVNDEVAKADLDKGSMLFGEVKEEEDKGWRVGLGLGDQAGGKGVEGWLVKADVEKHVPGGRLLPGQLIRAVITSVTAGGRVFNLTLDHDQILRSQMSEISNVSSILPGQQVNALITSVIPNGLNVKIGGMFDGTIDMAHLELGGQDIEEKYKAGKKIRARVIYDNLSVTPRRFGLSALPHILTLSSKTGSDGKTPLESAIPIGKVLNSVQVTRVLSEWGLLCRTEDGLQGFVHISHITDERLPTLSSSAGSYAVNTLHRARVIGHSPLDGVLLLSLEQKVLDQVFMTVNELQVGQVLKGTVRKLTDKALFVNISGSVDGVVWSHHFADIQLSHPERRFKVGASVKARVLSLEPARNRVVLTLKKSLVDSALDIVPDFKGYKQGVVVPGVVVKILDKGLVVELFGGLKAFVPSSEASQQFTFNLGEIFHIGKPAQLRIIEVRPETQSLTGSIRQATSTALAAAAIEIGSTVSGQVTQVHPEQIVITLQPSQGTALLSLSNLSNHREMTIDELRSSLKTGEVIKDLVVISKNPSTGLFIVSPPKTAGMALLRNAESSSTAEPLKVGDAVKGKVAGHARFLAIVQLSSGASAKLHPCDVSDDYATVTFMDQQGPLAYNEEVEGVVIKASPSGKNNEISTRTSRVSTNAESKGKVVDPEVGGIAGLKAGQEIRGFVKNVVGAGVFVAIARDVTARVMIKEMFDEFVKDWQSRFHIGQLVSGKILSVDIKADQVEMTLRTNASSKSKKKAGQLGLSDFQKDQTIVGVVKKVEPYGMFIRIDGSNISGLCHKSEITDSKKTDLAKALKSFREGDQVKAKILSVDVEKGRVSFGIKASYFAGEDGADEDEDDEDEEMNGSVGDGEEENDDEEEEEDDGEDEDQDEEVDEFDASQEEEEDEQEQGVSDADESDDDEALEIQVDEPSFSARKAVNARSAKTGTSAPPLDIGVGFTWSGDLPVAEESASSSESEDDEEDSAAIVSKTKSKGKSKAPLDLTASAPDSRPESTAEFERALLASPNSSFLWIQYMSFLLQLHEVDRARRIGRQALEKIGYREEEEKLNVWMALVNLELGFGSEESAEKVFKEAAEYNDTRTVYGRYVEALQAAGKDDLAEEIYKKLVKKFSAYPESWTGFAEYYLKKGNPEAARELLSRSLKSLDRSKHIETIRQMAVLEFRHGDSERGKTLFEGLVDRYPKKLDIWSMYIDQLAKIGDIQGVRGLFDRALDHKLNSKKAKFLFKKWLAVESRIGDESGQENAKERARAWVAANVAQVEGDDDEE